MEQRNLQLLITLKDQFSKEIANVGGSLSKVGEKIKDASASFAAIGIAAGAAVTSIAKAGIGIEDAMANVSKTTGVVGEELVTMRNELLEMGKSTRTPTEELIKLAEGAGRLGISGKENVLNFTDSINKLNVALGDEFAGGVDEITSSVGVLTNIFSEFAGKDKADSLLKIGNALNVLGAEGAASAPVISDFANRIGGLAGQLGAGNILGLSAALQELGVTAERGGSSVGQLVALMARPDNIKDFAKAADMTTKAFTKLVNETPNEALLILSEKIKTGSENSVEFNGILEKLGLTGSGVSEVVQKIGQSSDFVREKQRLANEALTNSNSLMTEYESKNNTTAASLEKLANYTLSAKIAIADLLMPAITSFIEFLTPVIASIQNFTKENETFTKVILGVVAAFTALVAITGAIMLVWPVLVAMFTAASVVFMFLLSPIGLIIAGIAALIAIGIALWKNWDTIKAKAGEVWQSVANTFSTVWEGIKNTFKSVINYIIDGINKVTSIANKIKIPEFAGGDGSSLLNIPQIPKLATGTNYVPDDTLAMIHKGEAVVPAKYNPANGGAGGGTTIVVNVNGVMALERNAARYLADLLSVELRKTIRV